MTKIDKKIVGFGIANNAEKSSPSAEQSADNSSENSSNNTAALEQTIEHMHENVGRPEMLVGATYKIKTPLSDHALYITINDIVLNPDTDHEQRRPFEIFINSKNLEHYQWVVALTRVISAVFRKGGDVTFLVEELKAVFDPQGGYFKSGGRFMPSLVAEIGDAIELHMKTIGLIQTEELSDIQKQILADKLQKYNEQNAIEPKADSGYPPSAQLCIKCHTKAVIVMDGCKTCLSCGDSKCS
ncbi:MAG: NrdJb [Cellvibrionaceae bacterium]|nr:NrdJb [Cellvibrionaceae bacterium]|tara:strand:- start:8924 stop:9649 length:726 start_codon:yes stop_codon:yes gene_type:complete